MKSDLKVQRLLKAPPDKLAINLQLIHFCNIYKIAIVKPINKIEQFAQR